VPQPTDQGGKLQLLPVEHSKLSVTAAVCPTGSKLSAQAASGHNEGAISTCVVTLQAGVLRKAPRSQAVTDYRHDCPAAHSTAQHSVAHSGSVNFCNGRPHRSKTAPCCTLILMCGPLASFQVASPG
jgi:hypothetical protein